MQTTFVPYLPLKRINASFEPKLSQHIEAVAQRGWYLNGEELSTFEYDFSDFVGTTRCIGTGNGLDALTLSLMAMKRQQGWSTEAEVVVPAMTFVATAEAVIRAGLTPVLADVDENALLTAQTAERVLTPQTRVLLPVHLYGQLAPMDNLLELANAHHLMVLEDAAQAHGAKRHGRSAGNWGNMAAFSFYPGKNLGALGDAGAVTTNSDELAELVRTLANYGATHKYYHEMLGINSRMDEVQAAALKLKLLRLDEDNAQRRHIAAIYRQTISNPAVCLPPASLGEDHVYHIFAIRCKQREALQQHLEDHGVSTLIHYPFTLAEQPALAPWCRQCAPQDFPQATAWAREEISLPVWPLMTDEEAHLVADAVNNFKG